MIPPADQGERAFVVVLRRRHPDVMFVVRDVGERPVRPEHAGVLGEVAARAPVDLDTVEEAGEHVATLGGVESVPEADQGTADGDPRDGG